MTYTIQLDIAQADLLRDALSAQRPTIIAAAVECYKTLGGTDAERDCERGLMVNEALADGSSEHEAIADAEEVIARMYPHPEAIMAHYQRYAAHHDLWMTLVAARCGTKKEGGTATLASFLGEVARDVESYGAPCHAAVRAWAVEACKDDPYALASLTRLGAEPGSCDA